MNSFFEIIGQDKKTKARAGILTTPHSQVQTPVFVPVGTQGTVKSLNNDDLSSIGVQIFLANTYHLYLRPGADTVAKLGGLHKFSGWNKPLMTDSGGFQVFSLGGIESRSLTNDFFGSRFARDETLHRTQASRHSQGERSKIGQAPSGQIAAPTIHQSGSTPSLVKIDNNGVTFRSHLDGSSHRFTPEVSIAVQQKLGADIILAFDECPPYGVEKEKARKAMVRTHDWALRCLNFKNKHNQKGQALFGIIQGGVFKDLREESAKFISSLALSGVEGFDGIAIGGVAVGESKKEMYQVIDWTIPYLPEEKPRHLLGVGEIDNLFEAVKRGVDMFDCVMPTRLGRTGHVLTKSKNKNFKFRVDITKAIFANDPRPPVEDCRCYTCQNYSRAYLNHLFRSRELLAYRLATYHNLWFVTDLMRQMREAIIKGEFLKLKKKWLG